MSYRSQYAKDWQRGFERGTAAKRARFAEEMRAKMVSASRGATKGMTFVPRTRGAASVTERKYFDSYLDDTTVSAGVTWAGTELDDATLLTLFCPVTGDDINSRHGRKVSVKKIQIRGNWVIPSQQNQTSGDNFGSIRMILYQDTQTNAAQAQGENLMANPGTASVVVCHNTFQNTANFGRFKVLKDFYLTPSMASLSWDGTNLEQNGQYIPFKITHKFKKPVTINFNATNGGTVADIVDNSFHLIAHYSSANPSNYVNYQCRTTYTDD